MIPNAGHALIKQYIYTMKTRIRMDSRPAQLSFSYNHRGLSQPLLPSLSKNKAKLHLPSIKKKNRYMFLDQITLSDDYIKICNDSEKERQLKKEPDFLLSINKRKRKSLHKKSQHPEAEDLSSSRLPTKERVQLYSSRIETERSNNIKNVNMQCCPLEDRVWQKQEEKEEQYRNLINCIKRKIAQRDRIRNQKGFELVLKRTKLF